MNRKSWMVAVLAGWRMLLDAGRLQDGEPHLAGTARPTVARLSSSTAAGIGAVDGQQVTVATGRGSVTVPLEVTAMPDGIVEGAQMAAMAATKLAEGKGDKQFYERKQHLARFFMDKILPDTSSLLGQLRQFRERREHFALVVDEYGTLMGIVTLEDILEEIVGEFTNDPATVSRRDVHREASGSVIVNASATVRALNRTMNWSLPTDGPKTLNGVLLERLETMPTAGTALQLGSLQIEILQMGENTIRTVRVRDAARR